MSKKVLLLGIIAICLLFSTPVVATEINLGGGYPLWDTHTDDNSTSFNGGYLIYGSVDKVKQDSKWLSYGLMYNYTRMELEARKTTTHQDDSWDRCTKGRECPPPPQVDEVICLTCDDFPIYNPEYTTTTTQRSWLSVHVLGPYVKPFYKISDRVKVFGMIGMGAMYVDGVIYGDEFGGAGFASAGLSLDITEHLGMGAQILYVKGATSNVNDIDYIAPVATLSYRW